MDNPWSDLPTIQPYVLPFDVDIINRLSIKHSRTAQLRFDVVPMPFIGNPLTSKVVLLALNPGFNEEDVRILDENPDLLEADRNNLTFNNSPSFYALNQSFSYSGLFKWWNRRLKEIVDIVGREKVSNSISCIQFFPYHSVTYSPLKELIPSQEYSFYLVKEAIKQKKVILIMRSRQLWEKYVPELIGYPYIELKIPRNPYFNSNNMTQKSFDSLLRAF